MKMQPRLHNANGNDIITINNDTNDTNSKQQQHDYKQLAVGAELFCADQRSASEGCSEAHIAV